MDSTPAIKRRRLNNNNPVNKPFKSPLRTPFKSSHADPKPPPPSPLSTAPIRLPFKNSQDEATNTITTASPIPRCPGRPEQAAVDTTPSTPALLTAHKQLRATETAILKARQEIDTLTQAIALLTSTKDAELALLVTKWRGAARSAAEEVFAGARDRVNRMGGVGAWRERERESREIQRGWDEVPKREEEEDEGDAREERVEEEWEYDREMREEREREEEPRDDDSFTMDMMLKMMNIDLSLIGFDKKRQRWVG